MFTIDSTIKGFVTHDQKDINFLNGYNEVYIHYKKGEPFVIKLFGSQLDTRLEDNPLKIKEIIDYIEKNTDVKKYPV